jgi:hypothetical protein
MPLGDHIAVSPLDPTEIWVRKTQGSPRLLATKNVSFDLARVKAFSSLAKLLVALRYGKSKSGRKLRFVECL